MVRIEDLVHDAVDTASSGVQPFELALEWGAHPAGIVDQRAEHELHDGSGGSFGEAGQLALGGPGDHKSVGGVLVHRFR